MRRFLEFNKNINSSFICAKTQPMYRRLCPWTDGQLLTQRSVSWSSLLDEISQGEPARMDATLRPFFHSCGWTLTEKNPVNNAFLRSRSQQRKRRRSSAGWHPEPQNNPPSLCLINTSTHAPCPLQGEVRSLEAGVRKQEWSKEKKICGHLWVCGQRHGKIQTFSTHWSLNVSCYRQGEGDGWGRGVSTVCSYSFILLLDPPCVYSAAALLWVQTPFRLFPYISYNHKGELSPNPSVGVVITQSTMWTFGGDAEKVGRGARASACCAHVRVWG